MKGALPPCYVNTPVPIAYAEVEDALIVTMTRILGLCWAFDYERTPALTPERLMELTCRARSTLYRHLKHLWRFIALLLSILLFSPRKANGQHCKGSGTSEQIPGFILTVQSHW